jgi:choloylglycine hydrolase
MDWGEDMYSNLWVFPRGMSRDGASGPNTIKWTSKYGSLAVSGYDAGTADGMNEKGLVMNGLYLAESDYGKPDGRPTTSIMAFGQYVLDNFGNVSEAVDGLRGDPISIIAPTLPNGRGAQLHMSLSDPTGDSAIFEWIDGKLVVHHGKDYRVMTNSPSFDQQLAINGYWKGVDPLTFLPGSINAADRFARVSFLINAIPRTGLQGYRRPGALLRHCAPLRWAGDQDPLHTRPVGGEGCTPVYDGHDQGDPRARTRSGNSTACGSAASDCRTGFQEQCDAAEKERRLRAAIRGF